MANSPDEPTVQTLVSFRMCLLRSVLVSRFVPPCRPLLWLAACSSSSLRTFASRSTVLHGGGGVESTREYFPALTQRESYGSDSICVAQRSTGALSVGEWASRAWISPWLRSSFSCTESGTLDQS